MNQLIYLLFMACMAETIPNPRTIENLTPEQTGLIQAYANEKCKQRVEFYLNINPEPMCAEWNTECM